MKEWIISDLHLGHDKVIEFSPLRLGGPMKDIQEHDMVLRERWNVTVAPNDLVWVLGDVALGRGALIDFAKWNGRKNLVRGNHDKEDEALYRSTFEKIHGAIKVRGVWLTHVPIHPDELYGRANIHGHVHLNTIMLPGTKLVDKRYTNVCIEAYEGWPQDFIKMAARAKRSYSK